MKMKLSLMTIASLLLSVSLCILTGCSGSNSLDGNSLEGRGSLELRVAWPTDSRVIPASAVTIKVTVYGAGLTSAREVEIQRPTSSVRINDLPVGVKSVSVGAFDATDMKVAEGYARNIMIANDRLVEVSITLTELTDIDAEIATAIDLVLQAKDATDPAQIESLSNTALGHLERAIGAAPQGTPAADKANFYWVLAKLGSVGANMAGDWGATGDTVPSTPIGNVVAPDPVAAVYMASKATSLPGAISMFDTSTVTDIVVPTQRVTSDSRSMPDSDSAKYNKAVADISTKLLPAFEGVNAHLQSLCREDLNLLLENPIDPDNPNAVLVLDYGDINAVRAAFQLIIGLLNSSLAYNLDPGSAGYRELAACDTNQDGRVTPTEYLPTASFGTLNANGRTRLTNSKQAFLSALTSLRAGAVYHLQPGILSRDYELLQTVSSQQIAAVRDIATYLQKPFTSPYTLSPWMTGLGQDVVVNLSATFDNPVTDIRNIAPTFVFVNGSYKADLSTCPDKTFGGLFPNALPNDLLYTVWNPERLFGDLTVIVD